MAWVNPRDLDRLRASHACTRPGKPLVPTSAIGNVPAATVAVVDAGGFVGELNLLTGQNVYLLCRVREADTVYRVSPERLRQLMANDVELSDIVSKALIARRAQRGRHGRGDRRRHQVGGGADAADLCRPAAPDPPLV